MKYYKKYIPIFASLFVLMSFYSCNKILEVAPDMRTDLDTPEKVGMLLVKAYPSGNYINFAESASDNADDKGPRTEGLQHASINRAPYEFEVTDESGRDSPVNYWNSSYKAIAAANHALEAIEKATRNQQAYNPYKGEALLARAYAHFMLVTFFSKAYDPNGSNDSPGIPYVTAPEKNVQPTYDRKTVEYVYEMIEKDLLEGLPLIQNSAYKTAPKYHFNAAAAHAFASRFYLFKKEYDKVDFHTKQIVPDGDFDGYLRPWISEYNNWSTTETREWYVGTDKQSNLLLAETTSSWGRRYYQYRFGLTYELNQIRMTEPNVTGASWGQRTSSYNSSVNRRHNKFVSHDVSTSLTSSTITRRTIVPLFTTEEALFNRAEAWAYLGRHQDALDDLNLYASERIVNYNADRHEITLDKIASFYNISDPTEGLVHTILDFKRSEFIQEGLRWFDILRHKITVRHNLLNTFGNVEKTIVVDADDMRRLFQLPEEAKLAGIELNPRP